MLFCFSCLNEPNNKQLYVYNTVKEITLILVDNHMSRIISIRHKKAMKTPKAVLDARSGSSDKSTDGLPTISHSLIALVVSTALFLRVLVGYQPHSGQNNHHGSKVAWGGDYEAQRHWMELTWHLPLGEWYYYDLQYWGLDYPPLTAYISYICGALSEWIVGPETVALVTSRGYENDPIHKAYMRATVYVLETIVYMPAAYYILKTLWSCEAKISNIHRQVIGSLENRFAISFAIALLQPSVILIDHGHFQYNTVALGLTLWSVYFLTQPDFFMGCIWGSVFYCLALNFKQMTLYYAPVIFAYLLGRCFSQPRCSSGSSNFLPRFVSLGLTVLICFAILWMPFLFHGPSDEEPSDSTLHLVVNRGKHVLHRIFPLERGLFEGKVSNLWCALDTKPINIRERIPASVQPLAALVMTVLLMIPACIKLFLIGKRTEQTTKSAANSKQSSDLQIILWGLTSSALAFFLASFQVHEKSILLALSTASMLGWEDALFVDWFGIFAAWTLWPLLVVDRLQVAYVCVLSIFMIVVWILRESKPPQQYSRVPSVLARCWHFLVKFSFFAMFGLHLLEVFVPVPSHLPDLFPVLWSIGGCALCCLAWARTIGALFASTSNSLKSTCKSKLE